jgi:hypothetical protein
LASGHYCFFRAQQLVDAPALDTLPRRQARDRDIEREARQGSARERFEPAGERPILLGRTPLQKALGRFAIIDALVPELVALKTSLFFSGERHSRVEAKDNVLGKYTSFALRTLDLELHRPLDELPPVGAKQQS